EVDGGVVPASSLASSTPSSLGPDPLSFPSDVPPTISSGVKIGSGSNCGGVTTKGKADSNGSSVLGRPTHLKGLPTSPVGVMRMSLPGSSCRRQSSRALQTSMAPSMSNSQDKPLLCT